MCLSCIKDDSGLQGLYDTATNELKGPVINGDAEEFIEWLYENQYSHATHKQLINLYHRWTEENE